MSDAASNQWHELVGSAFALKLEAFQRIAILPNGLWLALLIVLLSGLSIAVGQSIILFINRVKLGRFAFSLLLNAVLYTFGFIFLTLSTWLICLFPRSPHIPFLTLIEVFGLGYAPLLFGFLEALPYFGYPISNLLSVWNLLALVVGFSAVAQVGAGSALTYVALGWAVKFLLAGTIGQPIARLGRILAEWVAGVDLADTSQELKERILMGVRPAEPIITASKTRLPQVRKFIQASGRSASEEARNVAESLTSQPSATTPLNITQRTNTSDPFVRFDRKTHSIPPPVKLALSLLLMAIAFIIILVLLEPIRDGLFGWYANLHGFWGLLFDLVWIGIVAIVFAGILAPLESLGWWAGWYNDDLYTTPVSAADQSTSPSPPKSIARYVVYLDGIGQSGEEYTPDIEDFLKALKSALPSDMELVEGLMMYSVLNKPLDEDRPLAFLWRLADKTRLANPSALLGLLVNLRNMIIVAVSSDKRYGPIYNQGIAQVIFDELIKRGYQPGSGVPITLVGYSGGGEMSVASAPYLKRSTGAPIDTISLGGVMSANNDFLKLEQFYHIVGDKDNVERFGCIVFPGRWRIFPLSYWNRSKRKGRITIVSAGPVGHQIPGGYMDPKATMPDGRTHLQQTIEIIIKILRGDALKADLSSPQHFEEVSQNLL